MEIENPKGDKCKEDYLRINGPDGAKFYCGKLNGTKLLKMGPWGKGPKKIQISFRSDSDSKRGRGVKLHLYTKGMRKAPYLTQCGFMHQRSSNYPCQGNSKNISII